MNLRPTHIIFVLLLSACGGGPRLDTRTFDLKFLQAEDAAQVIRQYVYEDRPNARGTLSFRGSLLTVRETPDNLDKIARVLAEYDRPQPTVRLTFRLIRADGAGARDPAIADVEATLRQLFRFQGYRLVGEGVVSAMEGSEVTQMLGDAANRSELTAEIRRLSSDGDSGSVILQVRLNLFPGSFQTRVGVPLGKTAVLGNVAGGPAATALILTVRPELVRE